MRFMVTHTKSERADELIARLEALGRRSDKDYAPVVVDPASDRFVLRGEGSEASLERARRELGVEIYADGGIGPAASS